MCGFVHVICAWDLFVTHITAGGIHEYFLMQYEISTETMVLFVSRRGFLTLTWSLTRWGITWTVRARVGLHTLCCPNPVFPQNKISLSAVGPWCKLINSPPPFSSFSLAVTVMSFIYIFLLKSEGEERVLCRPAACLIWQVEFACGADRGRERAKCKEDVSFQVIWGGIPRSTTSY